MKYDLHIHSNVSDGKLSREELIQLALKNDLEYMAFTEHNTFKDTFTAGLHVINGIEFDVIFKTSFHLLCYFSRFDDSIQSLIKKYQENCNDRSEQLIDKISKTFGIPFDINIVKDDIKKSVITKRDIIDWLLKNKYASSVTEAANKYTNKKSKSYVSKYSLDFAEVADIIHSVNGYTFLAHPSALNFSLDSLELFVQELSDLGLDGIEIVNVSKMGYDNMDIYNSIAAKYGLMVCGGSDFHNPQKDVLGIENNISDELIRKLTK